MAETVSVLSLPVNMLHPWRREAKLTGRVFPGLGIARVQELADFKRPVKAGRAGKRNPQEDRECFAAVPK